MNTYLSTNRRTLFILLIVFLFLFMPLLVFAAQCPSTPDSTAITLSSLDPPPRPGEPAMSVTGLARRNAWIRLQP